MALLNIKRTNDAGFTREVRTVRGSGPDMSGRDRTDHDAAWSAKCEKARARREAREAVKAAQAEALEKIAAEMGTTVPLLRAKMLLETK